MQYLIVCFSSQLVKFRPITIICDTLRQPVADCDNLRQITKTCKITTICNELQQYVMQYDNRQQITTLCIVTIWILIIIGILQLMKKEKSNNPNKFLYKEKKNLMHFLIHFCTCLVTRHNQLHPKTFSTLLKVLPDVRFHDWYRHSIAIAIFSRNLITCTISPWCSSLDCSSLAGVKRKVWNRVE